MIPVFTPTITKKDIFFVMKNMLKNNISGTSPVVNQFEQNFSDYFNRDYGVSLSNGSVALDVAFKLFNFKEGDEVILPSFTIISCLSAVIRSGATPVFCDVDFDTWNMTLEDVKRVYSKKTKAVLAVHTYGLPSEISEISDFCKEQNLFLIEDTAEAHGVTIDGKKCGSFGDVSTFSFYANKHVTTGEGGMILTDSEELSKQAKKIRNLDFDSNKRFWHESLFWNYRLGGLQASLGISQLGNLGSTIDFKINQGNYYSNIFKNFDELIYLPKTKHKNIQNHYWVYGLVLKKEGIREKVTNELFENNIETRPFFHPLHLQPALPEKFKSNFDLSKSEYIGNNGFYIPMGKHISKNLQKKIANLVVESISKFT